MQRSLNLGCTAARHKQIGIDAVINARGGLQKLNDQNIEDIELRRDADAIRNRITQRVRWYGPNSRCLQRQRDRIAHLISSHDD